jgi:hypothetical protein
VDRVTPLKPLSRAQYTIAVLLGLRYSHHAIAETLHISVETVRTHMRDAAERIPGDMAREQKLVAWVRGASLDVLEGRTLRYEFMRDAAAGGFDVPEEQAAGF